MIDAIVAMLASAVTLAAALLRDPRSQ